MGSRLNYGSDAWGGSWGAVSAWGGSWGWSWGPLHEVEEHPEYYGGGRRRGSLDDERLHREHWDYIEALRNDQARKDVAGQVPAVERAPGSIAGVAPADSRAMRGNVVEHTMPDRASNVLDDPDALMALAVLIAEADD